MKLDLSLTALATAYAFFLGISYLYGFWDVFNIGYSIIIHFISPLDIFKAAIIPSVAILFYMSLHINSIDMDKLYKDTHLEKVNSGEKWKNFKSNFIFVSIVAMTIIGTLAYKGFYLNEAPYKQSSNNFFISYIIWLSLFTTNSFIPRINSNLRCIFLLILVFLPSTVYLTGVINGLSMKKQETNISALTDKNCPYFDNPKFIASYSEKTILYSPVMDAICITTPDFIRIRSEPKK